jgi:hypothetical protein
MRPEATGGAAANFAIRPSERSERPNQSRIARRCAEEE